ncbi:MAG: sugar phosphate isomerase/epimerase family protein, partial [Planctomycetota bacterium]|nr:sugar phosphate isomerase/epimerase family protein [Planctomycetota bacterium]
IAASGFKETEIMAEGDEWKDPGDHDADRIRKALDEFDINPRTIHTPMSGVNLCSTVEESRKHGLERIADAMRLMGKLGGNTAIVHPTGRPGPDEPPYSFENIGLAMETAHRSVSELIPMAEETGVRLALENLPSTSLPCRPLTSMQELRAFIADFPPEHVGLCLDTGHACICGFDPAEQARIASERLVALHLQDVDGEKDCHWIPGQGVINWSELGAALEAIQFSGARTFEITGGEETAREAAENCHAVCERWQKEGIS